MARIVETFTAAVDDSEHPHWRGPEGYAALTERPALIADTGDLRRLLLPGPDHLDAESAAWCIHAHLPYITLDKADG